MSEGTKAAAKAGQWVSYVLEEDGETKVRPALVIEAGEDGAADLQVFQHCRKDGGPGMGQAVTFREGVRYSAAKSPGTWHQ